MTRRGALGIAACLVAATLAPGSAGAQDGLEEIRRAWDACTTLLARAPDDWTGWRRNFEGGYADHFQFHEGADAAVLVQTWLIDAIATQTDTSCYRPDGTLAFVFTTMTSPNIAAEGGPTLTREGRIYVAPDGEVLLILGKVLENGVEVASMDDDRYSLARGCELTRPHFTTGEVHSHLLSELGDLDGSRPLFETRPFDWCNHPARAE